MDELMKLFRKFKLGNSLFTSVYSVTVEELELIKVHDATELSISKVVDELSNFIVSKHKSSITEELREDGKVKEYRIQLLVLKMQDFKTIVEAAIQEMPEEALNKIKLKV